MDDILREIVARLVAAEGRIAELERGEYAARAGVAETLSNDNVSISADGAASVKGLAIPYVRELTLDASGAITVDAADGFVSLDTYGDAASDDLVTIYGGVDGQLLLLRDVSNIRDVTVKHGTGNIICGADILLNGVADRLLLHYYGGSWYMLALGNSI